MITVFHIPVYDIPVYVHDDLKHIIFYWFVIKFLFYFSVWCIYIYLLLTLDISSLFKWVVCQWDSFLPQRMFFFNVCIYVLCISIFMYLIVMLIPSFFIKWYRYDILCIIMGDQYCLWNCGNFHKVMWKIWNLLWKWFCYMYTFLTCGEKNVCI